MARDLYKIESGKLRFFLHPGQTRAWRSDARFNLVLAGTQGGKTSFGPLWLHREIQRTANGHNDDYIAATSSYDLFKLKMLPEMRRYFCECLGWSYNAGDKLIVGPGGERIILRSAQAEGGLESSTAKGAWLDEWGQDCVSVDAWEAVQRRLSINQGRVLFTTTPYNLGWLKQQVYDRWVGGDSDYAVIQFRSCDNPSFPLAEYDRAERTLPDWKFQMFYNGVFSRPAGLIYSDYDEAKHCVRPFHIPDHWKRHVGVDFGPVNTALVWLAEEPNTGRLYVYRETHGQGKASTEYAVDALEYAEPVVNWLGGAKSEDEYRMAWRVKGVPVILPFINDVEPGIDRVIALFRQDRLFVFETCHGVRSQLGTYSRELDDSGEPLEKIKDKEKFHFLDSLRYVSSAFPVDAIIREPKPEVNDNPRVLPTRAERMAAKPETEEYL
jgi:hypothetical protein